MPRIKRPTLRISLLASALVVGLLTGTPGAQTQSVTSPGEVSLFNLELLENFDFPAGGGVKGTDLAFWNADVPLRDEDGEKVLDEEENVVFVNRDFVVVGAYQTGALIVDITDPEEAEEVAFVNCPQIRNDPSILEVEDGRVLLALAKDDFGGLICHPSAPRFGPNIHEGIAVFDVTDPVEWEVMYTVRFQSGAHNFTMHPTEPVGWASVGDIVGVSLTSYRAGIPIVDFSDPDSPVVTSVDFDPAIGSPHDLDFSLDGTRAYVANENHYVIMDSTDPLNPTMIAGPTSATTVNPGTYAHGAFVTPEKDIMVTNNESLALGGFFASGTGICPGEGIAFYDIETDESRPIPLSYWVPSVVGRTPDNRACTSHFGNIAPNGEVITIGWYIGGARVVDFSDPRAPVEVAHAVVENSESWAAKTYKGPYVYSGDIKRGLDIFKWTGDGPAPWEAETEDETQS